MVITSHEPLNEPLDLNAALRTELAAGAEDLRALKRWWRTPPDERPVPPPTRSGLADVASAKLRATLLHLALAHTRRRLHLRTWNDRAVATPAEQAQRLAEELDRLDRFLVTVPVLDQEWRAQLRVILARG
jgi:hypothetical protein